MQLVFNELSINADYEDMHMGEDVIEKFILTYSEAIKNTYGFKRSIITVVDLNSIQLGKKYSISKWRNSARADRELLRRFVNMCDRQNIICFSQDEREIVCEKGGGFGLLIAYENDTACISLMNDQFWEKFTVECDYYSLTEDQEYPVIVMNFSTPVHLQENFGTIQELRSKQVAEVATAAQLLDQLEELFPSLLFHKVAKNQLRHEVETQHVFMLCSKLMMLEKYFSTWDGNSFDETMFPTKSISPQSKETLARYEKEHTFIFEEKPILVSYHIRYTGNIPGRIYFYPDNASRKGYICSLTTKLPCVSSPKSKI